LSRFAGDQAQGNASHRLPAGVIDGVRPTEVLSPEIDKFVYRLPLDRQHRCLADAGITVSRPWPTQIAQHGVSLIEPI
jgi:transposase